MQVETVWALVLGYALGSIPFGLLLTKIAGLGDVRDIGSGNIGATNVLRTGNKGLAAGTLALDFLKGAIAVIAAGMIWWMLDGHDHGHAATLDWEFFIGPEIAAALGAVLGHCFPVWLKFKGGKGVATNAGVSFGLDLEIGLAYAAVWLAMLAIFRFSSLAGMSAVVGAVIAAWYFDYAGYIPVLILIAVLIIWLHRANIERLMRGEEPKIGSDK